MMLFFFSSRRRHTRYWRDWSSDVCSSDLGSRQAHDLVDERGLPGPVRPEQPVKAPGLDLQRDLVQRQQPVRVGLLEAPDLERRDPSVGTAVHRAPNTSSAAFSPESIEPFIEESSVYSPARKSPGVAVRFFGSFSWTPGGWANWP